MNKQLALIVIFTTVFIEVCSGLFTLQIVEASETFLLTPNDEIWYVFDEISPTEDSVEWREEGECAKPLIRISDGRWSVLICRFYLVKSESIFATFAEAFNWTLVKEDLEAEGRHYTSFEEFREEVSSDPGWWLSYSWHVDADWFGISSDRTAIIIDFNVETAQVVLRIWCYITNIPGFFIRSLYAADRRLEPILAGFDLSEVHFGSLEKLEWFEFYSGEITRYRVYLKAPANLLSVYGSDNSFSLSSRLDYISTTDREIKISMPSDTQVQSASPMDRASYGENTVVFTVNQGDIYPESFSVISGPPTKNLSQVFLENIADWVTDPSYWVVFGSLIAIVYGAFSGKRLWSRRKTYYRLYRSMVRIYDHYSTDFPKFDEEIENLSKAITQYFIENKINDDQFDRLLSRRDDLIERVKKIQNA